MRDKPKMRDVTDIYFLRLKAKAGVGSARRLIGESRQMIQASRELIQRSRCWDAKRTSSKRPLAAHWQPFKVSSSAANVRTPALIAARSRPGPLNAQTGSDELCRAFPTKQDPDTVTRCRVRPRLGVGLGGQPGTSATRILHPRRDTV